jgi:acyl-CoA thioester hydrolase
MKVHKTQVRARYAETDTTGIVYYGSYFVYFEVGRIELFRQFGLPYDRHLPIVETHCRYYASAVFDDLLEIHTFLEETRSKGFRLGNRVYRLREGTEPELLVEGWTAMVTVDDDNRPIPLPEAFQQAFEEKE